MPENMYSLSDIGALVNRDGFGGNGMWWVVILFFFVFGFGRNGFAGDTGALTRAELAQGFADNQIMNKLNGLENGICDGFYAQNTTMLNGFNSLAQEISNSRFAAQQCCCETNRNIDAVRYENARNTCDIVRAIEKDGAETRALINANTMQALRDKLAEQNQELQSANFQLSQLSQTQNIVNQLQPTPKPAYLTCSPYQSSFYAYNGLGCGCCGY